MHAIVNIEVIYGAEALGGQYRSRLLEGEDSDSDNNNYYTDGDNWESIYLLNRILN